MDIVHGCRCVSAGDHAAGSEIEIDTEADRKLCEYNKSKHYRAKLRALLLKCDDYRIYDSGTHSARDEGGSCGDRNGGGGYHNDDARGVEEERNAEGGVRVELVAHEHIPDDCEKRENKTDIGDDVGKTDARHEEIVDAQSKSDEYPRKA